MSDHMSRPSVRPGLETLEERNVPSVVTANFKDGNASDGLWRYDSATSNWAHLSASQSAQSEIDDSGNVCATFEKLAGVWRWSASSLGWQKLSDATASELEVTGGGVLYASFRTNNPSTDGIGTWRWSNAGWQQLSALGSAHLLASDSDAFFGEFGGGASGIWRWTPQAGWGKITSLLPAANGMPTATDDAGNYIAEFYNVGTSNGLWRWSPTSGWSHLSTQLPADLIVAENGVIYENRSLDGTWRYDPTRPQLGFVKITASFATSSDLAADSNGNLWGQYYKPGTATQEFWYYNAATGWSLVQTPATGGNYDSAVGANHEVFIDHATNGLWLYSTTGGKKISAATQIQNLASEGWDKIDY